MRGFVLQRAGAWPVPKLCAGIRNGVERSDLSCRLFRESLSGSDSVISHRYLQRISFNTSLFRGKTTRRRAGPDRGACSLR